MPVERLDLGGGIPSGRGVFLQSPGNVGDGAFHPLPPIADYATAIAETVRASFPAGALPLLQFETGRFQVANAALFLASVSDVKDGHSDPPRRFVTVDGSMQQFTGKGFMKTAFGTVVANRAAEPANALLADVVGQTCAYDSVAEDVFLPDVEPGDVICLMNHGAYGDTSGTNFNAMPRPAVVVVDDGRAALAKRHETLMDLVARYEGPLLDWQVPPA
jgi:diaminopimelate decarboxylase